MCSLCCPLPHLQVFALPVVPFHSLFIVPCRLAGKGRCRPLSPPTWLRFCSAVVSLSERTRDKWVHLRSGQFVREASVAIVYMQNGTSAVLHLQHALLAGGQQCREVDTPVQRRFGSRPHPFLLVVNLQGQRHERGEHGDGHFHDGVCAIAEVCAAVLRREQLLHPFIPATNPS